MRVLAELIGGGLLIVAIYIGTTKVCEVFSRGLENKNEKPEEENNNQEKDN